MLDLTPRIEQQRSRGRALAAFALRDGQTRLADLHQSGSAKVILPRVSGTVPEAVFLNTSGGLTGGDSLDLRLEVGPGCRVLATTQTAERAYQAQGPARVSVTAQVGAGGRLDWLPQETLLYQHSHLLRRTEIDLAPDAGCLMAETIILGRLAMGEVTRTAHLTDHRRVTRLGRPVWAARSGPPGLGRQPASDARSPAIGQPCPAGRVPRPGRGLPDRPGGRGCRGPGPRRAGAGRRLGLGGALRGADDSTRRLDAEA